MIVTSVRLRLSPAGNLRVRAVGSIVLEQCLQIEHIHVVELESGKMIVAMPSKFEFGKYHDMAHPITSELRRHINRTVLQEYELLTKSSEPAKLPE